MIKFLVKLANSLDNLGMTKLSNKIDLQILKFAQEAQAEAFGPEEQYPPAELITQLKSIASQMRQIAANYNTFLSNEHVRYITPVINNLVEDALRFNPDAEINSAPSDTDYNVWVIAFRTDYKVIFDWNDQSWDDDEQLTGAEEEQLTKECNSFVSEFLPLVEGFANTMAKVAQRAKSRTAQPAKKQLARSTQPQSKTHMILQIQTALRKGGFKEVQETGVWDQKTDATFKQYLNIKHKDKLVADPKKPGQTMFNGTLSNAWGVMARDVNYMFGPETSSTRTLLQPKF